MVESYRRGSRKPKSALLGNHQKCWIGGRNVVVEALRSGRWLPVEIVVSESLDDAVRTEIGELAGAATIPVTFAPHERLTELSHSREHQGCLAKMPPFPYVSLDAVLNSAGQSPLVVLLDSLQDPFNFGAICRVACVFGADAVIVGRQRQVDVTQQVARSSAGAVNRIPIAQTDDLVAAIESLKARGLLVLAATLSGRQSICEFDFTQPVAIVIGNEGQGVRPELIAACSAEVTIPQASNFDSLNAAVAAGVMLYEAHRQRG